MDTLLFIFADLYLVACFLIMHTGLKLIVVDQISVKDSYPFFNSPTKKRITTMIHPFDYTPEHFNPLEDDDTRPEEVEPVDMDDDYDGWEDNNQN